MQEGRRRGGKKRNGWKARRNGDKWRVKREEGWMKGGGSKEGRWIKSG